MTFNEILSQTIDMLQQHGRVSYRALKRQFELDDAYLEDLKEELLYAYSQVTKDEERGLVWVEASSPRAEATPSPNVLVPSVPEYSQPEAERRQLTVMFCDLVGSTELSGRLDPEELRDVIRAYQSTSTKVIEHYDGYIAQHLGDGLMVYFSWPQAHEDDAQRAVRAALGMVQAMGPLNEQLEQDKDVQLAVRIGIHTGPVVIGEIGSGASQEPLALGETPNVAARIQGLAEANTVVLSAAVYRLVQGYFDCADLGEPELRGVAEPLGVYQVLRESGAQGRLEITSTLTPLVGREQEVGLLLESWEQAKNGQGQVVLLSGEARIGKSRLVQVLKDHVADETPQLECRSSPYYQNTALYPIVDLIQRTLGWEQNHSSDEKLLRLEQALSQYQLPVEEAVSLMAGLLSLNLPEDQYPPLNLTPQRQRQKTLETIVAIIMELAQREPVLFILEDLHWTDPSTLEVLDLLINQTPTASLYTLLTCRPEFQSQWVNRSYVTQITLNRLTRDDIEQMIARVTGEKPIPNAVVEQLVEKTDGVPLYVEEMTKAVLESGMLKEVEGQYELTGPVSTLSIPATLRDSLMSRLDRLVTAKAVAQHASVIGRQFSYDLLQAVSDLDEATLQRELNRLVEAELLYQRGLVPNATYVFKHALIQDTAYQSLLRSTQQGYHRRISVVLAECFPETAENQPELLALHSDAAGLSEQAIQYWYRAGQQAVERSANIEAISHLTKGLEGLKTLPDPSEFVQQELDLLISLGPALIATKGFAAPDVEHAYARARELCRQAGETPQASILFGLWAFHHSRAEFQIGRELAETLRNLGHRTQDPALLAQAHRALGATLFYSGEVVAAQTRLEEGLSYYGDQPHQVATFRSGQDPGVASLCLVGFVQWLLGYPERALWKLNEALTLAQGLSHPHSLAHALSFSAWLHQLRREAPTTQVQAEAAIALSGEQAFPYYAALGTLLRGWAQTMRGQGEAGLTQMHQGLIAHRTIGNEVSRPHWLAGLAGAYGKAEQPEEGLSVLTEALSLVEQTGECWWEAELYRLKGDLLFSQSPGHQPGAETCFHQALDVSRRQKAKSLELRAATSLAKLWQHQGKRTEAHHLLAPVYNWFTEGFDTADLIDAKTLLDELEGW